MLTCCQHQPDNNWDKFYQLEICFWIIAFEDIAYKMECQLFCSQERWVYTSLRTFAYTVMYLYWFCIELIVLLNFISDHYNQQCSKSTWCFVHCKWHSLSKYWFCQVAVIQKWLEMYILSCLRECNFGEYSTHCGLKTQYDSLFVNVFVCRLS